MNWLNYDFLGMNILHWLLSAFIPLLLVGMTVAYLIINRHLLHRTSSVVNPLIVKIDALTGRTIENLPAVSGIFTQCRDDRIRRAFSVLEQDCKDLYKGQWLPDPGRGMSPEHIFRSSQVSGLSLRPSARILSIGALTSLASLLIQSQIPPPSQSLSLGLILLPLVIGLVGAMLTAPSAIETRKLVNNWLISLQNCLENRLPVYNDQAGVALLVDKFTEYDRQMNTSLQDFNKTAARLADSDMAEGIRRSVEQVLLGSVAPSIQQATSTLGSLANELTKRQETGMQDLAIRFATALSSDLANHLQPINKEIEQMGQLMNDVKNYIEYAMRALETTREQSASLLADSAGALQQMANARIELTADFARVDEQVKILADSTSSIAGQYVDKENNIVQSIELFGQTLDQYGQHLSNIVNTAITSMQNARQVAADQQDSAGIYIGAMQEQVRGLSGQLSADIQNLLSQVRQETSLIAEHSGTIGQQLSVLNNSLEHSLVDFTQASSQYVNQTLSSFDSGLAELVERMARTASEIRDAVDALPMAMRQGQGQGQSARFDG